MKPENADHTFTKALELLAYLELEGRNPIRTASGSSAGVNHITNQYLTDNTAIFDEFFRSLKRGTENMPHNQNRGSRDNSLSGERVEAASWTKEARMTHGRTQKADMETTHEKPETYTCLHAIDKTIAMIHAIDMNNDTIPESAGRNNKIDRFDLSHLAITEDKTAKT